jgi:hypothetical protein
MTTGTIVSVGLSLTGIAGRASELTSASVAKRSPDRRPVARSQGRRSARRLDLPQDDKSSREQRRPLVRA